MKHHLKHLILCMALAGTACTNDSETVPQQAGVGMMVWPEMLELRESGGSDKFTVLLNKMPSGPIIVRAQMSPVAQAQLSMSAGVIQPADWNRGFAFYVNCTDDGWRDGNQSVVVTFSVEAMDLEWGAIPPFSAVLTCIDDGSTSGNPVNPPVDDPVNPPVDDPVDPPVDDPVDPPVDDPVDPPVDDPVDPPVDDPVNPPVDDPVDPPVLADGVKIRLMAANITCTDKEKESYDCPASQRIFQAIQPDIVLIQEFKVLAMDEREFVDKVFGTEFDYFQGGTSATYTGSPKPNGVISRYPIIESGEWTPQYYYNSEPHYRNAYNDRNWTWAVVDIPGNRELLAVSVHLHTDKNRYEYFPLMEHIVKKQAEGNYYVVLGGDFNTKNTGDDRADVKNEPMMTDMFYMQTGEYPVDQNGHEQTNKKRGSILDWLLFSKSLEPYEIPLEIGSHTGASAYKHGHVFDSRVYDDHGELYYVRPVEAGDSGETDMQHMPVIRDIRLPKN